MRNKSRQARLEERLAAAEQEWKDNPRVYEMLLEFEAALQDRAPRRRRRSARPAPEPTPAAPVVCRCGGASSPARNPKESAKPCRRVSLRILIALLHGEAIRIANES